VQASQDDVVDRAVMKNMILDWNSKVGEERGMVMQVIASLLHFTEEEKEMCNVHERALRSYEKGLVGKVFEAPPPPKVAADKLEGDSVKDKFLSFLLAETGDS
jgi:hypothetical protein